MTTQEPSTTSGSAGTRGGRSVRRTVGVMTACALAAGALFSLRSGMFAQPVRAEFDGPAVTPGAAADGVIDVPAEARTLQAAIDAATTGQTVRLAAGTFNGGVRFGSSAIKIVGAGPGISIVRANGRGSIMEIAAPTGVEIKLEGFTLAGGSGITGAGVTVTSGAVDARRVDFRGNEGSAAVTLPRARAVFVDCAFAGNSSGFAGGALCNTGGIVMLVNCAFDGNTAQTFGGAVYSQGGTVDTIACTFTENQTTSGAYGGAVFGQDATMQVAGTSFDRNESREAGGAMYLRGGTAVIDRCRFSGNLAEGAWALYSSGAGVRLAGSTLCGDEHKLLGGDLAQGAGNAFDMGCFTDCNQNGTADSVEIARGWAHDIDGNGVPDECDIDWNQNGIPDAYEIAQGFEQDANGNGMIDSAEIRLGLARDDDHNLVPDDARVVAAAPAAKAGVAKAEPAAAPAVAPAAAPEAAPKERAARPARAARGKDADAAAHWRPSGS